MSTNTAPAPRRGRPGVWRPLTGLCLAALLPMLTVFVVTTPTAHAKGLKGKGTVGKMQVAGCKMKNIQYTYKVVGLLGEPFTLIQFTWEPDGDVPADCLPYDVVPSIQVTSPGMGTGWISHSTGVVGKFKYYDTTTTGKEWDALVCPQPGVTTGCLGKDDTKAFARRWKVVGFTITSDTTLSPALERMEREREAEVARKEEERLAKERAAREEQEKAEREEAEAAAAKRAKAEREAAERNKKASAAAAPTPRKATGGGTSGGGRSSSTSTRRSSSSSGTGSASTREFSASQATKTSSAPGAVGGIGGAGAAGLGAIAGSGGGGDEKSDIPEPGFFDYMADPLLAVAPAAGLVLFLGLMEPLIRAASFSGFKEYSAVEDAADVFIGPASPWGPTLELTGMIGLNFIEYELELAEGEALADTMVGTRGDILVRMGLVRGWFSTSSGGSRFGRVIEKSHPISSYLTTFGVGIQPLHGLFSPFLDVGYQWSDTDARTHSRFSPDAQARFGQGSFARRRGRAPVIRVGNTIHFGHTARTRYLDRWYSLSIGATFAGGDSADGVKESYWGGLGFSWGHL